MIGVIDYGMGNLLSVANAFEMIGADVKVCSHPEQLRQADRLVLPGVGNFAAGTKNLEESGMLQAVNEAVQNDGKPTFGICLGMQLMARTGHEDGQHSGLAWIDAEVKRLEPNDSALKVPHVGWHDVQWVDGSPLFMGLPEETDLYFTHSYYMSCDNQADVDAVCDYGGRFTAAVRKDNIFATQFHPEKSQEFGLQILRNFVSWNPE
jgi:glutamine amidotransferase